MPVRQQHLQVLKNQFHLKNLKPTLSKRERRASVAIILRVRPDGMPLGISANVENKTGESAFKGHGPSLCSSFQCKEKVTPEFQSICGFENTGPAVVDTGIGGFQKEKHEMNATDGVIPVHKEMSEILAECGIDPLHLDMNKWLAQEWVQSGQQECMYIRRAPNPGDLWSGQIGFPGGRKQGKESDLECVIREVFEEVNQSLGDASQYIHLGRLSDMNIAPAHASVKLFTVCTFVFLQVTPVTPPCLLEPKEISKAIYTPLDFFGINTNDKEEYSQPQKAFLAPSMHKVKRFWRASQVTKDMHRSWHAKDDNITDAPTSSTQQLQDVDSAILQLNTPNFPLNCSIKSNHEHKRNTALPTPLSFIETSTIQEQEDKKAQLLATLAPVYGDSTPALKTETVVLAYPPAARTSIATHMNALGRDRPVQQNSFTKGSYYNGPVTPWRYFDYLHYTRDKTSEASKAPSKEGRKAVSIPLVWYPFSIKVPCLLLPGSGIVHRQYLSDPCLIPHLPSTQMNLPFLSTEEGDPDCLLWGLTLRNTASFAASIGFPAAKEFVFGEMTRYRTELAYYYTYCRQYQNFKSLGKYISHIYSTKDATDEVVDEEEEPVLEEPESQGSTPQLVSKL